MERPHLLKSAEILGLSLKVLNGMSNAEFGKFWRGIAIKFHPDNYVAQNLTPEQIKEKETLFAHLNEAKEVVEEYVTSVTSKNQNSKRKRVDDSLCEVEESQKAKKPKELPYGYLTLELTKEQLLRGEKRDFDLEVSFTKRCEKCSGVGGEKEKSVECHFCNGYGRVYSRITDDGETNTPCPVCKGEKVVPIEDECLCTRCDGAGIEKVSYLHRVHVEHTATNNTKLGSAELKNGAEQVFKEIFITLSILNKV